MTFTFNCLITTLTAKLHHCLLITTFDSLFLDGTFGLCNFILFNANITVPGKTHFCVSNKLVIVQQPHAIWQKFPSFLIFYCFFTRLKGREIISTISYVKGIFLAWLIYLQYFKSHLTNLLKYFNKCYCFWFRQVYSIAFSL